MFEIIVMMIITLLGIGSLIRIIYGPSIWDRILGLNLFSSKIIMLVVIFAFYERKSFLLDIAIVFALLGFISITFISRFIMKKGKI